MYNRQWPKLDIAISTRSFVVCNCWCVLKGAFQLNQILCRTLELLQIDTLRWVYNDSTAVQSIYSHELTL